MTAIDHTPPSVSIVKNTGHVVNVRRRDDGRLAIRINRDNLGIKGTYAWMVIEPEEADALITCLIEMVR